MCRDMSGSTCTGHPFHRHDELWVCGNKRTERSTGFPLCGDPDADDLAGTLILLLQDHYPTLKTEGAKELAAVYLDLQKKCENAQISSRAMDLRGLLDGVALMEKGLNVQDALDMGITNKTFDPYEQTLIQDTIRGRISKKMKPEDLFEEKCGSCRKEFA